MKGITIGGLNNIQLSTFSSTSRYRIALSRDLLDWITESRISPEIPCTFTDSSPPLYISPNIYHTQITEYLLETLLHMWAYFFLHRMSS